MAQQIDVPGLGVLEFPDGMSDAQISNAIQRELQRTHTTSSTQKTPDVGAGEAAWLGLGRRADKMVSGITQALAAAKGDEPVLRGLEQREASMDEASAPLRRERPVASAMGEAIPSMPFGPIGAAVPGLVSYGTPEERLKRGGLDAAGNLVGGLIGKGVARVLKPAGPVAGLSDDALGAAKRLELKLSPGQRTGNPALLNLENYLARSPGSSSAMQARQEAQAAAINRAAGKAIGAPDGDLSEAGFAAAKDAIGAEFQRLQEVTNPKLGKDFMQAMIKVEADNASRGSFRSASVDAMLDKAIDLAAKNDLTGKAYKEIRSVLTANANAAYLGGDSIYGGALKTIRKALDDAAKESLSDADKAAWDLTRQQWAAYKTLTKGNVTEAGRVSAPRVAAEMRRGSDALRTGARTGPMADIARVGEAVKGVQNPNSGQLVSNMIYGNPLTGLPMMAGNKALQASYTNPVLERYLAGGIMNLGPRGYEALTMLGRPGGAPLVQGLLGVD